MSLVRQIPISVRTSLYLDSLLSCALDLLLSFGDFVGDIRMKFVVHFNEGAQMVLINLKKGDRNDSIVVSFSCKRKKNKTKTKRKSE